jgi:hypothetical protein
MPRAWRVRSTSRPRSFAAAVAALRAPVPLDVLVDHAPGDDHLLVQPDRTEVLALEADQEPADVVLVGEEEPDRRGIVDPNLILKLDREGVLDRLRSRK